MGFCRAFFVQTIKYLLSINHSFLVLDLKQYFTESFKFLSFISFNLGYLPE